MFRILGTSLPDKRFSRQVSDVEVFFWHLEHRCTFASFRSCSLHFYRPTLTYILVALGGLLLAGLCWTGFSEAKRGEIHI